MQILKISLKNLNSLAGSWTIDFQNEAYQQDGLFAITGPTGAGKTTILDAICLALYGKTPRLKGTVFSKDENEIMSRQTDDCEATVVFQTVKGRFRAEFSQRRTKRRDAKQPFADDKWSLFQLLQANDEINPDQEKNLAPRTSTECDALRLDIMGIDYEQFCRAVMLAQGDFQRFLKAKPEEKATLLEKITGTEIYTKIGQKVAEKFKEEKDKSKWLEEDLKGIKILLPEEVEQLTQEQDTLPCIQEEQERLREGIQEQINWCELLEKNQSAFNAAREEEQKIDEQIKSFEKQKDALQKDERTLPLGGDYQVVISAKENAKKAEEQFQSTQQNRLEQENKRSGLEKKITIQQQENKVAQDEWDSSIIPLQRTRLLDSQLDKLGTKLKEAKKDKEDRTASCKKIENDISLLTKEKEKVASLTKKYDSIEEHWKEKIGDQTGADLAAKSQELSHQQSQWENLQRITVSLGQLATSQKEGEQQLFDATIQLEKLEKEKSDIDEKCQRLDEQIAEQEEQAQRVTAVANLEEERLKLQEGVACPLCGSLEHPLAFDSIPILTETKAILKKLKSEQKALHTQREDFASKKGAGQTTLQQSQVQQLKVKQQYEEATKSLQDILVAMNIPVPLALEEIETKLHHVHEQNKEVTAQTTLAAKLEKERKAIEKELDSLKGKQQELSNLLTLQPLALNEQSRAEKTFEEAAHDDKTAREERISLLGDKNPDLVEADLKKKRETTQKKYEELKSLLTQLDTTLEHLRTSLATLRDEESKLKAESIETMNSFLEKITAAGFSNLNDFNASRLPDQERKKGQEMADRLSKQKAEMQGKINSIKETLEKELAKNLTPHFKEELVAQLEEVKKKIEEVIAKRVSLQNQLKDHQEKEKLKAEKTAEKAKQDAITTRWNNLNQLIGVGTNIRFTKIVQQMSLEILIDHTNTQLELLAPRFRLTLKEEKEGEEGKASSKSNKKTATDEGLEIYCIDSDLNSDVRPTKNLSGGETFLVSLALALGLSKMSSQSMTIGSLFLDEGFGSLDEDALNRALDALISFQSSDNTNQKIIGIISHVDALKDRIPNKIEVTKNSNGRSTLQGPGVTRH